MQTKSVFAVIHKSTKDFAFIIAAETKEQSEQTLRAHLNGNSEQYEVVETTLMFSDPFIQIQEHDVNPRKDMEREIEYCGAHYSNY